MVRRRVRRLGVEASAKERDQETIRIVNNALDSTQPDPAQLRKIAAVRGLVNNEVRGRAWPALLGVGSDDISDEEYERLSSGEHRDSGVVRVDVQRSLWAYTEGWPDADREEKRAALRRLLNASVCCHPPGDVFYYQGLHDIASVLLLVLGERQAFACLRVMVRSHLRDCTRPGMEPVLELLGMLLPVLEQADPELAELLDGLGLPPLYALPWVITLFSHNVAGLAPLARLFDLFLGSHPLMPLYASAVVMKASRNEVFRHCRDPSAVHSLLMRVDPLAGLGADELAQQAVALFKHAPPAALVKIKRVPIYGSVTPSAFLRDGIWTVPNKPYLPGRKPSAWGEQLLRALETFNPLPSSIGGTSSGGGSGGGGGKPPNRRASTARALAALGIPAVMVFMAATMVLQSERWMLLR